jgi:hypothetical protein
MTVRWYVVGIKPWLLHVHDRDNNSTEVIERHVGVRLRREEGDIFETVAGTRYSFPFGVSTFGARYMYCGPSYSDGL